MRDGEIVGMRFGPRFKFGTIAYAYMVSNTYDQLLYRDHMQMMADAGFGDPWNHCARMPTLVVVKDGVLSLPATDTSIEV